jgi:hypothetical protein
MPKVVAGASGPAVATGTAGRTGLRQLVATRYVTALREGGSVPALVEADDGELYIVKFRKAAQGLPALVAELIIGQLGRATGLPVPELALIEVDAALGRSEPHQEIRELLLGSAGLNLAMAYLAGSVGYDAAARAPVSGEFASAVVAFDAYCANVDRTARNPNLLWWQGALWLIDHGAALYWHHGYDVGSPESELLASARRPFTRVREHALLPFADHLPAAGAALAAALDDLSIDGAVAAVPDEWLIPDGRLPGDPRDAAPDGHRLRRAYATWLRERRSALPEIIEEADRVRAAGL